MLFQACATKSFSHVFLRAYPFNMNYNLSNTLTCKLMQMNYAFCSQYFDGCINNAGYLKPAKTILFACYYWLLASVFGANIYKLIVLCAQAGEM